VRPKALLPLLIIAWVCGTACAADGSSGDAPSRAHATSAPTSRPTATPLDVSAYPAGTIGYAISWPQCGAGFPDEPFDFGIIGVTNGEAFTRNPCFADEYRWAKRGAYHPSIYMNTGYIAVEAAFPECGTDDACRAYRYGWTAARNAYTYAATVDAIAPVWWLDVQIVSDWSEQPALNAQSIRGAGDFLASRGIRVGISSTAFQWSEVAGNAQHGLPVWDASALDADMAAVFCAEGKDFGGGDTELIAYVAEFETVLACGSVTAFR